MRLTDVVKSEIDPACMPSGTVRVDTLGILHGVVERHHESDYRGTCGLNPSTIVCRRKSALAARHAYEEEWKDTEAKLFGRCCHSLLFEQHTFGDRWAIWPEGKRRHGKEWDAFCEEHSGREIIKDGDQLYGFQNAIKACTAAVKKRSVAKLISEGVAEVAIYTGELGMQCKGRVDWIDTKGGNLVDAKFTNSIEPEAFGRGAGGFGYHIKMSIYREWLQRESGKQIHGVYLIACEVQPPFDVAVVRVTPDQLEDGWSQAQELIRQIRDDIDSGEFHGVDGGEECIDLMLPYWAMQAEPMRFEGAEEIEVIE